MYALGYGIFVNSVQSHQCVTLNLQFTNVCTRLRYFTFFKTYLHKVQLKLLCVTATMSTKEKKKKNFFYTYYVLIN